MKRLIIFLLISVITFSAVGFAEEINSNPQTVCPVMGGKIDKNVYIDYQEARIYFCCPSCKTAFLEEPGNYMKELAEEKVLLEKSPRK